MITQSEKNAHDIERPLQRPLRLSNRNYYRFASSTYDNPVIIKNKISGVSEHSSTEHILNWVLGLNNVYVKVPHLAHLILFIMRHEYLLTLIEDTLPELQTYFPKGVFTLEVITDHEENFERLYISIDPKNTNIETVESQFDLLLEEWWFENLARTQDKMGLLIRYR